MSWRLRWASVLALSLATLVHTAPSATNQSEQAKPQPRQGWTSQPDGRGTLDILWSCLFTMFLCSWSVLCLNIPGPDDNTFCILRRKFYLTSLGFLAPELHFQLALGQWLSARQSVKDFRASGFKEWGMKYAFFADMGGFLLHSRDWVPFPLNAKQLHYLVVNKFVEYPYPNIINDRMIEDKNKVDSLLRVITVLQTVWFAINLAGRAAWGLEITTIELTAGGFVFCSVCTVVCWFYKPADVTDPCRIWLNDSVTIGDILKQAGRSHTPHDITPLDFISRNEWLYSRIWSNWANILRKMHVFYRNDTGTVNRWRNTQFLNTGSAITIQYILTAGYFAIFMAGWNYNFPTLVEKNLWRAASVTQMAVIVICSTVPELMVRAKLLYSPEETTGISETVPKPLWSRFRRKLSSIASRIRNNSVGRDPQLYTPLKFLIPSYIAGVLYVSARGYILLEDIIELRSLPTSAFQTVDWWKVLPHF